MLETELSALSLKNQGLPFYQNFREYVFLRILPAHLDLIYIKYFSATEEHCYK